MGSSGSSLLVALFSSERVVTDKMRSRIVQMRYTAQDFVWGFISIYSLRLHCAMHMFGRWAVHIDLLFSSVCLCWRAKSYLADVPVAVDVLIGIAVL